MNKGIRPIDVNHFYAVLVALYREEDEWYILLEKRASTIPQPNEISFPGGKIEAGESPSQAAVRETAEELCIDQNQIEVYQAMDYVLTPFNTCIYPIIGEVKVWPHSPSSDEVAELVKVPLSYFENYLPEAYDGKLRMELAEGFPFDRIHGGENYNWKMGTYKILFYEYEGHSIWGITAKIIHHFIHHYKDDFMEQLKAIDKQVKID